MAKIKQIINGDDKLVRSGAVIEFNSGELVTLSNALYEYFKEVGVDKNKKQLRDIIHIASQVSQYGHIDEWAVSVLSRTVEDYSKKTEDDNLLVRGKDNVSI